MDSTWLLLPEESERRDQYLRSSSGQRFLNYGHLGECQDHLTSDFIVSCFGGQCVGFGKFNYLRPDYCSCYRYCYFVDLTVVGAKD